MVLNNDQIMYKEPDSQRNQEDGYLSGNDGIVLDIDRRHRDGGKEGFVLAGSVCQLDTSWSQERMEPQLRKCVLEIQLSGISSFMSTEGGPSPL